MGAANAAIYGEGKTAGTSSGPTAEFNALPFDQRMALFDVIQRKVDIDTPQMKQLGKRMSKIQSDINKLRSLNYEKSAEITKTIKENKTDWTSYYEISGQLTKAQMTKINIDNEIKQQAAKNLLESVKQAQTEYNQIVAEESKDLTEYRNKISDILKEIPTFENRADSLVDLDPVRLRAKLVDLQNDGTLNESAAVEAALKELGELETCL